MKKYIFLDFDGVLNTHKFIQTYMNHGLVPGQKHDPAAYLDPIAIARVNELRKALDADIVISSAWRDSYDLAGLQDLLSRRGLDSQIVGVTPILKTPRGREIQAWMDEHGVKEEQIVILDDIANMEHLTHRHVHTSFYIGLTDEKVQEALGLFQ